MTNSLDLNLMRFLVALDHERNVSRGAERLGVSQPRFSIALAKLRKHFADPLFVRTSHGMEPTPRARELVVRARAALEQIDGGVVESQPFEPATSTHTFSLALSDVGEIVFLPPLLQAFAKQAPHARLRSVSLPPERIEQGLENGEIDLAIGYFPDLVRGNFLQQRLFTHHFASLMRGDHPLAGRRLSLAQFTRAGHAVVRAEGRSQEVLEDFLHKRRIERRVVLETPHFMSLPFIVARTDLIATVPHAIGLSYARAHANIGIAEPPRGFPRFDLKQHWHRRFHNDTRLTWLRELSASLFNDAADEWRTETND